MKQQIEVRLEEEDALRYFGKDCGLVINDYKGEPWIRQLTAQVGSPLYEKIGHVKRKNARIFFSWSISFKPTAAEIEKAELFVLKIKSAFGPCGIECGTVYDDSNLCPSCRAGGRQVSDLVLDMRKLPRTRDVARTLTEEWVVTQRLAEVLVDNQVSGIELKPVRHKAYHRNVPHKLEWVPSGRELLERAERVGLTPHSHAFWVWLNREEQRELCDKAEEENVARLEKRTRRGKPIPPWYQLIVTAPAPLAVPPTRYGINPWDEDKKGRCRCLLGQPRGHLAGLRRFSPLHVARAECPDVDVCCTANLIGAYTEIYRPQPEILISARLRRILVENQIKGCGFEIAYLE